MRKTLSTRGILGVAGRHDAAGPELSSWRSHAKLGSIRIARRRGAWMLSAGRQGAKDSSRHAPSPAVVCAWLVLCAGFSGCATMRREAPSPDLRPCTDGYAYTADGWRLGVRHYRPEQPDPGKLPVILCHGLGLNATFWTITDNHLPAQLDRAGIRGLRLRHPGLGRECPAGPERPDQPAAPADPVPRTGRAALERRRPGSLRRAGDPRLRGARDRAAIGSTGSATAWAGC